MKDTAAILNEFFDKIYVINLTRATDRQAHIRKIFKEVDFEFFVASDKNDLDYEKALKEGLFDEYNAKSLSRSPQQLTLAHIACSWSHRRVYEDMLAKGYERVLIFEDDITVLPEARNLTQAIEELPADWDVFLLGHLKTKMLTQKRKFDQFVYKAFRLLRIANWQRRSKHYIENRYTKEYSENLLKIGEFTGLHAYGVSATGARKLVDYQTPIRYTGDGLPNYANLQEGNLNLYGIAPSLFSQESDGGQFASDISDYKPAE